MAAYPVPGPPFAPALPHPTQFAIPGTPHPGTPNRAVPPLPTVTFADIMGRGGGHPDAGAPAPEEHDCDEESAVITDTGAYIDPKGKIVVITDKGKKFLQENTPMAQKDVYLALVLSTLQGVSGIIPDPFQDEDHGLSLAVRAVAESAHTARTAPANPPGQSAPPGFFAQPAQTTKLLPTDLLCCLLFRLLLAFEAPPWQDCADWAHDKDNLTCTRRGLTFSLHPITPPSTSKKRSRPPAQK
eukprot:gene7086-6712_t